MKIPRRMRRIVAWLLPIAIAVWGASAAAIAWVSSDRVFDASSIDSLPSCRAAVVLGCRKVLPNGLHNLYFARRIAATAEL